jgi:hypothetical protein
MLAVPDFLFSILTYELRRTVRNPCLKFGIMLNHVRSEGCREASGPDGNFDISYLGLLDRDNVRRYFH